MSCGGPRGDDWLDAMTALLILALVVVYSARGGG